MKIFFKFWVKVKQTRNTKLETCSTALSNGSVPAKDTCSSSIVMFEFHGRENKKKKKKKVVYFIVDFQNRWNETLS